MARRRLDKRHIRKLTKTGGKSIGLTLPIDLIRKLKWRERQRVVVKLSGRNIIISDWKK